MALSFNKQTGGAQKSSINTFQYKDGDNKMRVVGDILARYVYSTTKSRTGYESTTPTLNVAGATLVKLLTQAMA